VGTGEIASAISKRLAGFIDITEAGAAADSHRFPIQVRLRTPAAPQKAFKDRQKDNIARGAARVKENHTPGVFPSMRTAPFCGVSRERGLRRRYTLERSPLRGAKTKTSTKTAVETSTTAAPDAMSRK